MSKVSEITGKIVDYKVKESPLNLISSDEEKGVITAVVTESEEEPNSLYIGNEHIASGYGFDNLADKAAVEELLSNKKIQDLLKGDNTHEIVNPEPSEDPEYINSAITVHDSVISMINGELHADSWVRISDVVIKLSNGDYLYGGQNYQYYITDQDIYIEKIQFNYTISKESSTDNKLFYKLDYSINQFVPSFNFTDTTEFNIIPDGKQHACEIQINTVLTKNYDSLDNKYPINLVITNENKTKRLFENICTIEFLFPVFLSSTTSLDDIKLHNDERCNYYKDSKETEISLPLINESTFNYIWVPTILTANGFSIIHKDSNLKVAWKLNKTAIRLDTAVDTDAQISYDRYISPWKYIGKISWIIK